MTAVHTTMSMDELSASGLANKGPQVAAWLGLALLVLLPFMLDYPAVLRAVDVWFVSPTYHHCPLIILVAGYCLWRSRSRWSGQVLQPCWPAMFLLPCVTLLWLIAAALDIDEARQLLLVAFVHAGVLSFAGPRIYRSLLFPLVYLIFAVPTGAFLVPYLQAFTTWFCTAGLDLLNIPYDVEGYLITLQSGIFEVAEACAGLRFLVATVAFAALFSYLVTPSMRDRFLFLLLSLVIPVVINGLRALALILIGHYSDLTLAVGIDHFVYGWGFFVAVLAVLIYVGLKFRQPGYDAWSAPTAPSHQPRIVHPTGRRLVWAGLLVGAGMSIGPAYAGYLKSLPQSVDSVLTTELRPAPAWSVQEPYTNWAPDSDGVRQFQHQQFSRNNITFDFYQLAFSEVRNQLEKADATPRFVAGGDWTMGPRGKTNFSLFGTETTASTVLLHSQTGMKLIYYWYVVHGNVLADPDQVREAYLKARLLPGGQSLGMIVIAADLTAPLPELQQSLRRFILDTPELRAALVSPGASRL